MEIAREVYTLVKNLPKHELYGLRSQMTRAAVSMPSNIAEGCAKSSKKDLKRYLEIALGSAYELETQFMLCTDEYISKEAGDEINVKIRTFQRMLTSFWQKIDEDIKQQERRKGK